MLNYNDHKLRQTFVNDDKLNTAIQDPPLFFCSFHPVWQWLSQLKTSLDVVT